jgi:luciferase family oxidoreductase group 1
MLLSVLDQSPIPEGSTPAEALQRTLDLAELADSLGYQRYWVAEHHATPALACAAPEILIGAIAPRTKRIRVGSGGVMLPHYSPLKVAEVFSILCGLHPGRIDLGLGRAPGTDQHTIFAIHRDRRQGAPDDFPEQLAELLAYLEDDFPESHAFRRLAALPGGDERPDVWLLGSSPQSAIWAAGLGLPYSFADFINPTGAAYAQAYRERFAPSRRREAAEVAVCVAALCAESDEEAVRLAAPWRAAFTALRQGRSVAIPPVDKAERFLAEHRPVDRRVVLGSPETVRAGLEAVALEYDADELMIVTIAHGHETRRRSYELIAQALL